MTRYALRHTDGAGIVHCWSVGDTSAHWVARWHARDSGRPTEVWRDGALVCTWSPHGEPEGDWPVWDDDEDTPSGPLCATHSAEQPDPRGIPCPNSQRTTQRPTEEG